MSDPVNQPSHYVVGGLEMFETFRTVYGSEAALGFALGNVFKYSWRAANKNAKHADRSKQIDTKGATSRSACRAAAKNHSRAGRH